MDAGFCAGEFFTHDRNRRTQPAVSGMHVQSDRTAANFAILNRGKRAGRGVDDSGEDRSAVEGQTTRDSTSSVIAECNHKRSAEILDFFGKGQQKKPRHPEAAIAQTEAEVSLGLQFFRVTRTRFPVLNMPGAGQGHERSTCQRSRLAECDIRHVTCFPSSGKSFRSG